VSRKLLESPREAIRLYVSLRFFVHSRRLALPRHAGVYPRSLPQLLSNSAARFHGSRPPTNEEIGMCRRTTCSGTFRPTPLTGPPYSSLRKGGDPAAGSPTATLLRLRPSHCARLRRLGPLRVPTPTSGAHSFHGVTGGVYKARERIHRGVADPRLLAIPASCRRVADDNPN
jgi:hypothetical protein